MTSIEVLLNNLNVAAYSAGASALGLWGLFYFFRTLFGEGGRNPVKLAVAAMAITGAGGMFALLPTLLSAGQDTGHQLGGGSYSMPAPAWSVISDTNGPIAITAAP